MYTITDETKLTNDQAIFWLCHKLGIELPFLGANPSCHQTCINAGPGKIGPNHEYYGLMRHAYHQASCSLMRTTSARHDAVLEAFDKYLKRYLHLTSNLGEFLQKDEGSNKSTDILVGYPNQAWRRSMSGDYTCICPFLTRYHKKAVDDFRAMIEGRAEEKVGRHSEWCDKTHNRDFLAIPGTTLGSIGGDDFWEWYDGIWDKAARDEVAAGGSRHELDRHKQDLLAMAHAIIIRYTTNHIIALSGRIH